MGKFKDKEIINKIQSEQDKDCIIADLTSQLADAKQQINDLSNIVADMQLKQGGAV